MIDSYNLDFCVDSIEILDAYRTVSSNCFELDGPKRLILIWV
jgi:hypothetical protein